MTVASWLVESSFFGLVVSSALLESLNYFTTEKWKFVQDVPASQNAVNVMAVLT